MKSKLIGGVVLCLILGAGVWIYARYRESLAFYVRLYNAYRVGQEFYAEYEHLVKNVTFQPELDVTLDVYSPETGTNHPVLIFVHGGGWDSYHKEIFSPVAMKLIPEQMVVVIPDYTLHPQADYEQMTGDVAAAVSWTLENIDQYGGDPNRVVIVGHSAGGHLAGLTVLDPHFLSLYGHTPAEICGLIGLSGVYDIEAQYAYEQAKGNTAPVMTAVMGGHTNFANASPISYARPDLPKILLIHGSQDPTVPVSIASDFQTALQQANAHSELKIYQGADHIDFLFAALTEDRAQIVTDLSDFIHSCPR